MAPPWGVDSGRWVGALVRDRGWAWPSDGACAGGLVAS